MPGRNLTLTLSDDLVRRVKVLAARRDTSISALVSELLETATADDDYERVWQDEVARMSDDTGFRIGEITWSREDAHTR